MKILFSLLFFFVINGYQFSFGQTISRGTFIYNLDYLDSVKAHASSQMALPSKIVSSWNDELLRTDIISPYFSNYSFTNLTSRRYTDYLHFAGKSLSVTGNMDSLIGIAKNRSPYTFKYYPEFIYIQGFSCKKVIAHFSDPQIPDAIIIYCPDLKPLPNTFTLAFSQLNGLIVDMVSQYQGISIHLKLEKHETQVDEHLFASPEGYKSYRDEEALHKLLMP